MDSQFHVLDAARAGERQQWLKHWKSWHRNEVFAHPTYVELFLREGQSARCAVLSSADGCVIYPFVLRDLSKEPYWHDRKRRGADIVTPYGYGGPHCWNVTNHHELAYEFWNRFKLWTEENNIISEFVRFSLFHEALLQYPGHIEPRLKNIVRNLDVDSESIWKEYKHKVRKNVNRAETRNVRVVVDLQGRYLDQFIDVYYATMIRRTAVDSYYFPRSFFERLRDSLSGQYAFFHAFSGDEIISTEVVLVSKDNVYSFLGGTRVEYFDLRPNDLLKHHIILWSLGQNKKNFVLGGGYHDDDGIYQYKQSFAPNGVTTFKVGWRVLNESLYDDLVKASNKLRKIPIDIESGYFPAYRA